LGLNQSFPNKMNGIVEADEMYFLESFNRPLKNPALSV
jgi:hypothetical protein